MPEVFTREQELLKRLRDERCGGNAAELARRLKKDATYVNRLLYPVGKKGRKGIGLEIMRAASDAFSLPPGYWEGADAIETSTTPADRPPTLDYNIPPENVFEAMTEAEKAMLTNYRTMSDDDRREIDTEIELRAAKSRALMRQFLERFGVVNADDISDEEAVAAFRKMFEASQRLFEAPKDQPQEK